MPDFGATELLIGGQILGGLMGADAAQSAGETQAAAADRSSAQQMAMYDRTNSNLAPWRDSGRMSLSKLSGLLGLQGSPSGNLTSDQVQSLYGHYLGRQAAPEEVSWQMANTGTAKAFEDSISQPGANGEYGARVAAGKGVSPLYQYGEQSNSGQGSLLKPFGMEDFQESPAYQFNLAQGQKAIDKASNARGKYYAPATLQDIAKFSQGMASNEFQNAYGNYNTNMRNIWDRLYSMSGTGQNAAAQTGAFGTTVAGNVGNNITSAGAAQAAGGVGAANAVSGGINGAYNGYMTNQILQSLQAPAYRPQVQSSIPGQFNSDTYG